MSKPDTPLADECLPMQRVGLAPSRTGRVYLAGPMSGIAEHNFPAFHAAAALLRAEGLQVVNPAEHGLAEGAEWADYLRYDIAKIAICESMAVLPGWSQSRGARLETHLARALGMPIRLLEGAEPAGAHDGGGLTFAAFRAANVARCLKWHPAGIDSWSTSDWMTAIMGELGEAASLIKMRNRLPDGRIQDGHRRLHCTSNSHGGGCPVPGSSSAAPFERALMTYCSDMVNLQALYAGDRSTEPRARAAALRTQLVDMERKLERLTDAMLAADADGGSPAAFVRRAREMEAQIATSRVELAAAEHDLASTARTSLAGADDAWRALAAGVEAQDTDARLQARQLVADTFERIVIYHSGVRPDEAPDRQMDMMLLAKGGRARMLRIDRQGSLLAHEDLAGA